MSLRRGKVSRGQIMKTLLNLAEGWWTLSCKCWGAICFKAALVARAVKEVDRVTLEQGRPVRLLRILSGTRL